MTEKRIIRVFPRRTKATPDDELAFVGEPPFWRPEADEVHVSCTFTWDKPRAKKLAQEWGSYYPVVKVGGPAFATYAGDFTPGMYLKRGYVITTRGCPNSCSFCFVPEREGLLRCVRIRDGWIVTDNNLLAAPRGHIEQVLDMLARQPKRAEFTGGLEAGRIDEWFVQAITAIRFKRAYLAYDRSSQRKAVAGAIRLLHWYGVPYWSIGVYVLMGHSGDTIAAAEARLQFVKDRGAVPWPMFFQPEQKQRKSAEWADLQAKILTRIGT